MSCLIDNLFSIGPACRTRYQIEQFLKRKKPDYLPTSYFFDYLMGGGISGVINVIERGFVLCESDIVIEERNGYFLPYDRKSGFFFLHDFGSINKWWSTYDECSYALDIELQNSLNKYNYLGRKTIDLFHKGGFIAFIYHGVSSQSLFDELCMLIRMKYTEKFILVNVLEADELIYKCNDVLTLSVEDIYSSKIGTSNEWQGCNDSWYEALSQLSFS